MPRCAHPRMLAVAAVAAALCCVPVSPAAAKSGANSPASTTAPATTPPTTTPPPAPGTGSKLDDTVAVPPTMPDPTTPPPAPVPDSGGPSQQASAQVQAQAKLDYSKFADAAKQVQERTLAAAAAAEKYEELKAQVDEFSRDINDVTRQVTLQQKGVDALRASVRERAAALYAQSGTIARPDTGDSSDLLDDMRTTELAETVARADKQRTDDLQRRLTRLARTKAALTAKQATLKKAEDEAQKNQQEVQTALAISQIYFEQTKAELRIVSSNGKVCPIAGPVTFTNDWGQPRSGGRTHKGTDLINPYGTPNVAIVSGTITFDVDTLGGNGVQLWGDDGNRYYYAHLSRWEGQPRRVNQGEVVGYTGDSGNARGGIPHTHFQMHPGRGDPANPYPTLAPLCLGLTGAEGPDPNYRPPN